MTFKFESGSQKQLQRDMRKIYESSLYVERIKYEKIYKTNAKVTNTILKCCISIELTL